MPIVRVTWLAGRTKEQKDELAKAITEAVVRVSNTKAESTQDIFEDVPRDSWSKAGVLASDW